MSHLAGSALLFEQIERHMPQDDKILLTVIFLDLPGNLGMAAHGIDAHDAACQFQLLQQ